LIVFLGNTPLHLACMLGHKGLLFFSIMVGVGA